MDFIESTVSLIHSFNVKLERTQIHWSHGKVQWDSSTVIGDNHEISGSIV